MTTANGYAQYLTKRKTSSAFSFTMQQNRVYNSAQMADMEQYRKANGDKVKEGQVRFATGVDYSAFLGSALEDSIAKLSTAPDRQSVDFRSACVLVLHSVSWHCTRPPSTAKTVYTTPC